MVNLIEDPEGSDDQAKCLVRKFDDPHDKSINIDKFECFIDKKKTVRQFVHIVAQHYNLDVDSFYLTFSSFKSDFTLENKNKDNTGVKVLRCKDKDRIRPIRTKVSNKLLMFF